MVATIARRPATWLDRLEDRSGQPVNCSGVAILYDCLQRGIGRDALECSRNCAAGDLGGVARDDSDGDSARAGTAHQDASAEPGQSISRTGFEFV